MVLEKQFEDVSILNAENFFEAIVLLKNISFDLVILDINIPGEKAQK